MGSICNFIPQKTCEGNIQTVNFVYETEFRKMKQPFCPVLYQIFLVTKGSGELVLYGKKTVLSEGTLFFSFPGSCYEIRGSKDFTYMYISFLGSCVEMQYKQLGITLHNAVYPDFGHLLPFWRDAIRRIDQRNANMLTEAVLLNTLSYISAGEQTAAEERKHTELIDEILGFVDKNYGDPDLSLRKIAGIFSYTDKYLSSLFSKNLHVRFTRYLNELRIRHALLLIEQGMTSVSEIGKQCGFSDNLYFCKVFRKILGTPPSEYIRKEKIRNEEDA